MWETGTHVKLQHVATGQVLPPTFVVTQFEQEDEALGDTALIDLVFEVLPGSFTEEEDKTFHGHRIEDWLKQHSGPRYLRAAADGSAGWDADGYAVSKTHEARFLPTYHNPHPAGTFDRPHSTEGLDHREVVASFRSRAVVESIHDTQEGHQAPYGTYFGLKGGVLVSTAGMGPDSEFRVKLAESKPSEPALGGRLRHELEQKQD